MSYLSLTSHWLQTDYRKETLHPVSYFIMHCCLKVSSMFQQFFLLLFKKMSGKKSRLSYCLLIINCMAVTPRKAFDFSSHTFAKKSFQQDTEGFNVVSCRKETISGRERSWVVRVSKGLCTAAHIRNPGFYCRDTNVSQCFQSCNYSCKTLD